MPALLDDPQHWRSRAEEARTVGEQLSDPWPAPGLDDTRLS
jgi:hypothetical protein